MTTQERPLVLCVDDDENMRRAVARTLREAGLEVALAGDGPDAIQQVRDRTPDLVLLDVRMPGMDGYEVCSQLQLDERAANVPIIFITGLGEEQDKLRALSAGAVDYVVKPFQQEGLVTMVREHLHASTRWKRLHGENSRIRLGDFVKFKGLLLERLDADAPVRDQCAAAAPGDLYPFARDHGVSSGILARWIAEFLGLPFVEDIRPGDIATDVLPFQFCRSNGVVAIDGGEGDHAFLMGNPFDWQVLDMLRTHVDPGVPLPLQIADPDSLRELLRSRKASPREKLEVVGPLGAEVTGARREARVRQTIRDEITAFDVLAESEAPAVQLANSLIAEAVRMQASDIHIEPGETELGLRYRMDGMLVPREPIPKALQASVLSRVKIMARLDIAERRVPQDGRVRVVIESRPVDLRVSTLPTRYGEKIVIRILDKSAVTLDLEALGLEEGPLEALKASIEKPHGILLVTGPTGSGKTTTLYSALTGLNQPHANIVTVEDPIEFELPKVNQVQVHPAAGLTFPVALRAILRQDPDIVMVGEIRDAETLDIAMKAALTGHLVLSTLHTNDAVSTISRLIDMGSEPFMVASTVEMISAQRLLRKLCPACREPAQVPEEILAGFGVALPGDARFFRARGCPQCNQVGYRGRLAVAEVLLLDEEWRRLITRSTDLTALRQHARDAGQMATLRQNALRKAARGLTSLEEVLRVTV